MRSFPDISRNIKNLCVGGPSIVGRWSHPKRLVGRDLKRLTHVPENIRKLDLSGSGIESIPDYVSGLRRLQTLIIENCRKLVSVADLPFSLKSLHADNCVSLEKVKLFSVRELMFRNCLRLNEEARRQIIHHLKAKYVCLPGKELPVEYTHKATENSITISPGNASSRFKACLLLSPIKDNALLHVTCYLRNKEGVAVNQINYLALTSEQPPQFQMQHLFILRGDFSHQQNGSPEVDVHTSEILFEFTCSDNQKIIECGIQILKDGYDDYLDSEPKAVGNICYQNVEVSKHIDCWSCFKKLGLRKRRQSLHSDL